MEHIILSILIFCCCLFSAILWEKLDCGSFPLKVKHLQRYPIFLILSKFRVTIVKNYNAITENNLNILYSGEAYKELFRSKKFKNLKVLSFSVFDEEEIYIFVKE